MARLTLLRKHQDGLRVFVLHPGQWLVVKLGNVQRELPSGVWVQPHPDLMDRRQQLRSGRIARDQAGDTTDVCLGQHSGLREDQAEDRVIGRRRPVDEVVHHVGIGAERQHGRHRAHGQPLIGWQAGSLHELVEVLR